MSEPEAVAAQVVGGAEPSSTFVPCPRCDKQFVAAAIVRSKPEFSVEWGQYCLVEKLYCDHCNRIAMWERACDSAGFKLGRVVSSFPTYITSPASIDRFLKHHPEARGVLHTERP